MKKYLILLMGMLVNSTAWSQLIYPKTRQMEQTDVYHGVSVADPYRWLEDDNSAETKDWVKAQNNVSFGYLETLPLRETFKKRIEQLSDYEKISAPFKRGDWFYFYKNSGLQNQSVLYRQVAPGHFEDAFLNISLNDLPSGPLFAFVDLNNLDTL